MTRTTNFQELSIAFNGFSSKIAESESLADIFARGMVSFAALEGSDRVRFSMLMSEALTITQLGFRQRAGGLLEDSVTGDFMEATRRMFFAPGVVEWWASVREYYHPDFRDYVDRAYISDRSPPPAA